MNVKALIPGIMQRSLHGGYAVTRDEAEGIAREMLEIEDFGNRMTFLDDRLSIASEKYHLHRFLTKRADYRIEIHG